MKDCSFGGVFRIIVGVGLSESRGVRACEGMSVFVVSNGPCFENYCGAQNVVLPHLLHGRTESSVLFST